MSLADAASENGRVQALARDNVDFQSERAEREVAAAARLARTAEDPLAAIRQMFRWACKRQPWHSLLVDGNPADLVELRHVVPQDYVTVIRDRTLCAEKIRELRDVFSAAMEAA